MRINLNCVLYHYVMITVISKHLGLFQKRQPISAEDYLGAIHYIEQIRYKGNRFNYLCSSNININAPADFSSGIDIEGQELNRLYSGMIMWFELESFIRSGKSFLDHLWRIVAQNHPELVSDPNLKKQKYILKAFNELKSKDHRFKYCETYKVIDNSLNAWGRYLIGFRNYIEYAKPIGGMNRGVAIRDMYTHQNSMTTTDLLLPDRFPNHKESQKTFQFSFNDEIRISKLIPTIVDNIDTVFPVIVIEIHNNSMQKKAKT